MDVLAKAVVAVIDLLRAHKRVMVREMCIRDRVSWENKEMFAYHQKGKIEALKAEQRKATYLV